MSQLVSTTVGFFNMSDTSARVGVMEYSESARVWIRLGFLQIFNIFKLEKPSIEQRKIVLRNVELKLCWSADTIS